MVGRPPEKTLSIVVKSGESTLGKSNHLTMGESSGSLLGTKLKENTKSIVVKDSGQSSDVEKDSSDIDSSGAQTDSNESSDHQGYTVVIPKKKKKGTRGKSPKST